MKVTCYTRLFKDKNEILRLLVVLCLVATIVLAGYFPYTFFRQLAQSRARQEYAAVAAFAETSFQQGLTNNIDALAILDTIFQSHCPRAEDWPNCSVTPQLFETLSDSMTHVAGITSIGMAPLVLPAEVRSVEEYVSQEVYIAHGITDFGLWTYPNSTTRGITAVNYTVGNIYHDTEPSPLSDYDYLVPITHFSRATRTSRVVILYNMHTEIQRVRAVDASIACRLRGETSGCEAITDFIYSQFSGRTDPAALTVRAVMVDNQTKAIVFTTHYWSTLIEYSLPDYVEGIDIVIETSSDSFTYTYNKGSMKPPQRGDKHSSKHDNTKRSMVALIRGDGVEYTVSYYATDHFFAQFRDNRDIYSCIIGVMIAIVTAFFFFIYDMFLSRTARENEVILATKRAFVRYISHEIRTPLNTVNVGLKVLFQELHSLPNTLSEAKHAAPNGTRRDASTCSGSSSDMVTSEAGLMESKKEELMRLVMEIEESSDAAVGILNDLINFDKISMGTMRLDLQPINIWEFLDVAVSPFMLQAKQKGISMIVDLEPFRQSSPATASELASVRVIADVVKLTHVMRNLVSNALKFTPGGGSVTVAGE